MEVINGLELGGRTHQILKESISRQNAGRSLQIIMVGRPWGPDKEWKGRARSALICPSKMAAVLGAGLGHRLCAGLCACCGPGPLTVDPASGFIPPAAPLPPLWLIFSRGVGQCCPGVSFPHRPHCLPGVIQTPPCVSPEN